MLFNSLFQALLKSLLQQEGYNYVSDNETGTSTKIVRDMRKKIEVCFLNSDRYLVSDTTGYTDLT